jgi:hypothetical protein
MRFNRLALAILGLPLFLVAWTPLAAVDQPPKLGTTEPLPESVKYWVLFRHLTVLEAKAAALEKSGEDGTPYRSVYRLSAKLTETQASQLRSIAADCVARVEEKDREALAVIRAARALNPRGRLGKDEVPPEPPAALKVLQQERDELIEAAREDLHRTFEDKEFTRFQGFVDEKIAPTIRRQQAALNGMAVPPLPKSGRSLPPSANPSHP